MIKKTPIEEAVCEIRNGAINLIAILRKVDQEKKNLVSAWFEMVSQNQRILDGLKMIKENL